MTEPTEPDCPHCPDGHREPTSRPWGVYVAPEVDSDGQPVRLHVQPSNGAHVAHSDAEWLWHLIRDARPPARRADPDQPCYHPELHVDVAFGRIGEDDPGNPTPGMPTSFVLEIKARCLACDEPFVFDGVPAGLSFSAPAVSLDSRELRAPVRPVSLPPRHRRLPPGSPDGVGVERHE
jgi:hypothetical protein